MQTVLGPTLDTERLVLRPPEGQDLDAWSEMMAHPEAARFLGGPMPRSMTWRLLATMVGSWALNGFGMFSVIEKSSGRWLGRVGPWAPEGWPGTEIGWGLHPRAWGQGYAVEAASATIDWCFDELGWTEIIHSIAPDNRASQRLAHRLGSKNKGPGSLPPPSDDIAVEIWHQTRAEWRSVSKQLA